MLERLRNEPALVSGAVLAVIGVLSAFGLGITEGQAEAVVSLVGSALALATALFTRSKVTPTRKTQGGSR